MDKTIKKRNIKIFILCKKGVDHIVVGRIFKLSKSTINFIYNRLTGEKAIIKRKLSDAIKEIENFKKYADYRYRMTSPQYNYLVEEADFLAYMYQRLYI